MTKTYKTTIDMNTMSDIIHIATITDAHVEVYENGVLDSAVIAHTDRIKFGRIKPRKYMIIRSVYQNCWSSTLELTMTDDIKIYEQHREELENNQSEEEN